MGKKGQLSIETMILYGLIALVALAAVAALIYFDVLNLGSYLPDKCDIGGSGDMNCEEIRVVSTPPVGNTVGNLNVQLGIRNIGQKTITDVEVCIHGDTFMQPVAGGNDFCEPLLTTSGGTSIPTGEMGVVTFTDTIAGAGNAKGSFTGKLTASYEYTGGVVEQAAVGSLRAKVTNMG
jgi:hypothetical protein